MSHPKQILKNIQTFTDRPLYRTNAVHTRSRYQPEFFGKVAVLLGGRSAERKISLESGKNCLEALQRNGINAHAIDPDDDLPQKLREGHYDRVLIMLHGTEGEDGTIQGLLEVMGIPYTGSGVAASALAMNKSRAKLVMSALDIPTPPFGVAHSLEDAISIASELNFPLSVKPVNEGSSIGVTRIENIDQLNNAYARAAVYGEVMIEEWIDGVDFFVSIVGDSVLPSVMVKPAAQFYDYHAKYESDKTQYLCPAPISSEAESVLRDLAYRAFHALGCTGWGRVDVVQDKQGKFWILEVNTIPGMTSHSLVPMSAKAQGMSFDALIMAILETSVKVDQVSVGKFA